MTSVLSREMGFGSKQCKERLTTLADGEDTKSENICIDLAGVCDKEGGWLRERAWELESLV